MTCTIKTEDMYGNDCFSGIPGLSTPNDGSNGAPAQTTAGYNVSGRDLGPSHNQDHSQYLGLQQQHHNKGAALENDSHPFHWPHFTTTPTNMSPLDHGNFDSRHYSMAMFDHMPADLGYAGLQHGLPGATGSNWVEPDMPLLGESVLCNRFSPTGTAYSSFSSTGSIVGTSMTLNSMGAHTGRGELNMTCPSTVSPKMLQNNPSPAPTSSSESVHTSFMSTGDEFPSNSFLEQHGVPSVVPSSKRATHRARKELPDKSKSASRHLSAPSDHSSSAKGKASISNHRHQQQQQTLAHRSKLHDIKPKPADGSTLASMPDSNPDPVVTAQTIERNKKDEFLIKSKLAGMTYREIRRKGNFSEAESTLRGRFRTLTKHKEARVRKPEWTENDLRVLRKAVRKFAKGEDPTTSKIPWKQVAEYIDNNGGSYLFGNATCRKRWDELVAQGKAFK
ncbi:hypothetical protein BJ170DRAFT_355873 [Xylariales sp. AK1849]|nr:hypothetical protein BJ170DRAFT_355873 [Xylariales sp. AK1849]